MKDVLPDSGFFSDSLADRDPEIFGAVASELGRQRDEIELIASENIVSRAVLEAQGSVMTNKYAEGYPGRRYYGGCQFVDVAETLAIERACKLFDAGFANVQPNSGSQANQAVFLALLKPGDTFLAMDLSAGGHLTHGAKPNVSGKWFDAVHYGVRRQDQRIDYDAVAEIAAEKKPKLIIAGGSAIPRIIDFAKFREVADSVGAWLMVDMAHFAGLVASGHYPNPLAHAHVATTTTHKTLRGPRGGMILTNDEALAKKFNAAIFPGIQGGPLMHVIAAKAVAFGEALRPEFKDYQAAVIANAQHAGRDADEGRARHRHRRNRHASDAGRPATQGRDRRRHRKGARPRAHHLQQERRAVRPGPADRDLGRAPRHAGRHHPWLRPGRVRRDRAHDRRGRRRPRRQRRRRQRRGRRRGQGAGPGVVRPFPGVPRGVTRRRASRHGNGRPAQAWRSVAAETVTPIAAAA